MKAATSGLGRAIRFAPLLAGVLLAACGSPTSSSHSGRKTSAELTDTIAAVRGLPLTQRDSELLTLAKKEGNHLSFYTTLNPTVLGPLVSGFQRRYGIHVSAYTTAASSLVQRMNEETRAGRRAADVVDTGGPELNYLAAHDDFADFSSPLQAQLGPNAVQRGWTTTRYTQFVIAWNTRRVRPGRQPKSWQELAEPKWKGTISLSPDTTGVSLYKALSDYWKKSRGWSQAHIDRIFEAIARNSRIVASTAENGQLLASGEIDVAAGSVATNNVDDLRAKGAPVAWQPAVEPIVRQRQGAALVRDAPHPAAALLFLDYEMGSGQMVFVADHRTPARTDLQHASVRAVVVDLDALAAQHARLEQRWGKIIALGQH